MELITQCIRTSLRPGERLGGRPRLVLASMAMVAMAMSLYLATGGPEVEGDDRHLLLLVMVAVAAILAYLLHFVFALGHWTLDGYDRRARIDFHRFAKLGLLVGMFVLLASMFRYEASGPFAGSAGCWYMERDRWFGGASIAQVPCPVEPRTKPRPSGSRFPSKQGRSLVI